MRERGQPRRTPSLGAIPKKVLRDGLGNRARALLVVLSMAVGVFAAGSMASARLIILEDLQAQYDASYDTSVNISASRLTEDFIDSVREMPGVAEAEGRTVILLRVRIPTPEGVKRSNLILNVLPDFAAPRISLINIIAGPAEPPRREMILERASLELLGVAGIGDSITVELNNGTTRQIRVAGLATDINAPPPRFANFGTGYITFDTLAWLGYSRDYGQMRVRVSEGLTDRAHITAVANEIQKRVEDSGRSFGSAGIQQSPGKHFANDQLQAVSLILAAIGGLALLLSGFLVVNTVTAILQQHVRQIGIMKAVGARGRQLVLMYLAMTLTLAVISLFVALPLTDLGAHAIASYMAGLLNFEITTVGTPPEAVALQIAVGLVVPALAALAPILTGTRLSVREAMTWSSLSLGGTGARRRSPLLARLPRPLTLSARNTFRRASRLTLTLGTLALSSAMFVSVFGVRASLDHALDRSLAYWSFDVEVSLAQFAPEDRLVSEALAVPGVTGAQAWYFGGARRVHADGTLSRGLAIDAVPADTPYLRPTLLAGRWLIPEDRAALVVNTAFLEDEPDVGVGDVIPLRVGSRTFPFEIVGVTESALTGQVRNARRAYANLSGYRDVVGIGRVARTLVVTTESHDPAAQARTARALETQFKGRNLRVDTYETISERRDQIDFQFQILIVFLGMMAGLLSVVGGLGLAGTMSMNVLERTREIGVMRAIGAGDFAVRAIVVVEGLVIGWLAWALGGLLAAPLSAAMSVAVGQAFIRQALPFVYAWPGLGVWLLVISVLSVGASLVPAWRASTLTVRDALAYE